MHISPTFNSVIFSAIFSAIFAFSFSNYAVACGGADMENDQVISSPEVIKVIANIQSTYTQSVTVVDIVRSKNELLNLDRQVVARAMCDANFINVYLQTGTEKNLQCVVTFDGASNGRLNVDNGEIRGLCQLLGQPQKLLVTRFP